ncbi:MAG: glutamate--cysteine ligase [Bacteriovoracia bacterium]
MDPESQISNFLRNGAARLEDCIDRNSFSCVRSKLKHFLESKRIEDIISVNRKGEPFYSSIDIRDSGFKLAPVDANLFPAGFNNVCDDDIENSKTLVKETLTAHLGFLPKKIAILPEAHTKNRFYADNLLNLKQVFEQVGIQVEIGWWINPDVQLPQSIDTPIELETTAGEKILAWPFHVENNKLIFKPFEPEFVLLNNDFSSGYPAILDKITQPIEPSFRLGWHRRKKSDFFRIYNQMVADLAIASDIDPWRLQVSTRLVSGINFDEAIGMEKIATSVDELIEEMKIAYASRNIDQKPFVFVKSNAGTYGMNILRVESGNELLELNRREKNKMAVGKNKLQTNEVIVQEGIPTRIMEEGVFGEPVIYMIGSQVLGGFLRTNPLRGKIDNLNSKGMVFRKLCISDLRRDTDRDIELELVYGVIAHLAVAAMSSETVDVMSSFQ